MGSHPEEKTGHLLVAACMEHNASPWTQHLRGGVGTEHPNQSND